MSTETDNWIKNSLNQNFQFALSKGHLNISEINQDQTPSKLISLAYVAGDQSEQIFETDEKVAKLYKESPQSAAFYNAFSKAPATGMSSVLNLSLQSSNYSAQNGFDGFNDFITRVGSCPFLELKSSNNVSSSKMKIFDKSESLVNYIVNNFLSENETLSKQISSLISEVNNSLELSIIEHKISGISPVNYSVNAGKFTISSEIKIKDQDHPHKSKYTEYSLTYKDFDVVYSLASDIWQNNAEKIANVSFCSIEEWDKKMTVLSACELIKPSTV